jgi:membrane protein DedA with SNARE-associated domain
MEQYLNIFIEFLKGLNDILLYIALFLSAIIENLFPPIPGDTITALGAFLVGIGRLNYAIVYIATTIGSVIGFMMLFFLGRYLEREFFLKKDFKFFSKETIIDAEKKFSKFGYYIVLGNRFMPGVRSVISIVSGISKLNPIKVFILSLISAAIWNLIWIQTGYTLGGNWNIVKTKMAEIMKNYNIAATIIITTLIVIYIVYRIIQKKKDKKDEKQEDARN